MHHFFVGWILGRLCALEVFKRGRRHRPRRSHRPAYSLIREAPSPRTLLAIDPAEIGRECLVVVVHPRPNCTFGSSVFHSHIHLTRSCEPIRFRSIFLGICSVNSSPSLCTQIPLLQVFLFSDDSFLFQSYPRKVLFAFHKQEQVDG